MDVFKFKNLGTFFFFKIFKCLPKGLIVCRHANCDAGAPTWHCESQAQSSFVAQSA
jgi:hypothetical protein